jgi:hypothetical protein
MSSRSWVDTKTDWSPRHLQSDLAFRLKGLIVYSEIVLDNFSSKTKKCRLMRSPPCLCVWVSSCPPINFWTNILACTARCSAVIWKGERNDNGGKIAVVWRPCAIDLVKAEVHFVGPGVPDALCQYCTTCACWGNLEVNPCSLCKELSEHIPESSNYPFLK